MGTGFCTIAGKTGEGRIWRFRAKLLTGPAKILTWAERLGIARDFGSKQIYSSQPALR
jgi:hypothetical protein